MIRKFFVVLLSLFVADVNPVSAKDAADTAWHQEPFMLEVDGVPLDIGNRELGGYFGESPLDLSDRYGHAAPFLADVDADGRRDLVVGSFSGRFRFYRNVGSDADPRFGKAFAWIMAGDELAQVRIYCCVASGPQLYDIDGDGALDLTAGSYEPGAMYWFKGLGRGRFATRQILTTWKGVPVFAHLETMASTPWQSGMSNLAWADWNADGKPDLIFGNDEGELFVRLSWQAEDGRIKHTGAAGLASQPVFVDQQLEIRIDGGKAIAERHCAPSVADWDGDGLWDLLLGTNTGAVYFLRNTGTEGGPQFKSRTAILGPGQMKQWDGRGELLSRGVRSQIHAVDYNQDGALDLLVGDWSLTLTPRTDLTRQEQQKVRAVRAQLAAIDRQVGFDNSGHRSAWTPYRDNKELLKQANVLSGELLPYLEGYEDRNINPEKQMKQHGRVWVFLQKPAAAGK